MRSRRQTKHGTDATTEQSVRQQQELRSISWVRKCGSWFGSSATRMWHETAVKTWSSESTSKDCLFSCQAACRRRKVPVHRDLRECKKLCRGVYRHARYRGNYKEEKRSGAQL